MTNFRVDVFKVFAELYKGFLKIALICSFMQNSLFTNNCRLKQNFKSVQANITFIFTVVGHFV